ncbi:MAG TPA: tetratricopeptide repeat protein [Trichormus sp.]|jgi:tetratricopeptide (TPR) repeat protein
MRTPIRFTKSALCTCQAVLVLLASTGPAALAASSTASGAQSETAKLETFERAVFGQAHAEMSAENRLRELEVNLFGKAKSGPMPQRLAAVQQALGGANSNLLMPAMAPQMDRSSTTIGADSTPQTAPNSVANEAPEPASRSDAGKEELHKAMAFYQQGNLPQAEQAFHKVLAIDPRSSDAYYNLGVIAEGHGDFQSALNDYQAAYNINPSDSDLRNAVTSMQTKIGDKIAAERQQRDQQQTAQKQAQEQQVRANLKQLTSEASTAFKAGNFDKAISNLRIVAQQAPNDGDVQYALSQAYRGKGEMEQAREAIAKAVYLSPGNQTYKQVQSQLNEQIAQGGGAGTASGGAPAPAPDYRNGGGNQLPYNGDPASASGASAPLTGSAQDTAKVGQLTPFSDQNASQFNSSVPQRGYAFGGGMLGGGSGYGYNSGGTSSRLQRAAVRGAMGAAMGGVMSSMFAPRGYRGRSAMQGALFGGALGLLMGGLSSH